MSSRIDSVRKIIEKVKIDAFFVTNQQNVSYLTGFSGLSPHEREGFLFITPNYAYLLTFPTYFGLYEKGGEGFVTLNISQSKKLSDHLSEIIKKEKILSFGFEKENLTVAELDSLKNKLEIQFTETSGVVENLRILKTPEEISYIQKAAYITDLAFDFIQTKIIKGVSEKDLSFELEFFLKKNADGVAFPPIVAFDKNAAIPHYLPNNKEHITNNNLILMDFGAKVNGYCADMTRVIFFGTPKDRWVKVYETVLAAQKIALESLKTEIAASEPDGKAREYLKACNFPDYPHGLGHGVGLSIHEAPRLRKESMEILKENMVVTVEPGIYIPGECGVRIEDLVVLRKDGIEILSKSDKTLLVVGG